MDLGSLKRTERGLKSISGDAWRSLSRGDHELVHREFP
jgi:hypothetical protein